MEEHGCLPMASHRAHCAATASQDKLRQVSVPPGVADARSAAAEALAADATGDSSPAEDSPGDDLEHLLDLEPVARLASYLKAWNDGDLSPEKSYEYHHDPQALKASRKELTAILKETVAQELTTGDVDAVLMSSLGVASDMVGKLLLWHIFASLSLQRKLYFHGLQEDLLPCAMATACLFALPAPPMPKHALFSTCSAFSRRSILTAKAWGRVIDFLSMPEVACWWSRARTPVTLPMLNSEEVGIGLCSPTPEGLQVGSFVRESLQKTLHLQGQPVSPVHWSCTHAGKRILRTILNIRSRAAGELELPELPAALALLVVGLYWRLRSGIPGILVCDSYFAVALAIAPLLSRMLKVPCAYAIYPGEGDDELEACVRLAQRQPRLLVVCCDQPPVADQDFNSASATALQRLLVDEDWEVSYPLAVIASRHMSLLMDLTKPLLDLLVHCPW
eukprot:TRINITY_DN29755_c0_g1_i1.p1 TRINITY_DN29755_c0_g1~~TRINITY_DN29755_c0_g1_i1.p1  ORF type:complete len:449 (-),score=60.84 TRINITY_DN29755_c0_g1_i1:172-1518(-)